MENQQKINFSIVVFVFVMHILLFWAVFKEQHVEYDQNITLDYVNLGVDEGSSGSDKNLPAPATSPSLPPKVILQMKRVAAEQVRIKPVVTSRKDSYFQTQQEKKTRSQPVANKTKQISQSVSNANTSINSRNITQGSNGDSKDGKSGETGNNGAGNTKNVIEIPQEYKGSYLPGLKPVYPQVSRDAGEKGVVSIAVSVSAEGKPMSVTVRKSSGYGRLDRSAVIAVKNHRFIPATKGGKPIPYQYTFNVNFYY
jgi:periplasmic protein TonB